MGHLQTPIQRPGGDKPKGHIITLHSIQMTGSNTCHRMASAANVKGMSTDFICLLCFMTQIKSYANQISRSPTNLRMFFSTYSVKYTFITTLNKHFFELRPLPLPEAGQGLLYTLERSHCCNGSICVNTAHCHQRQATCVPCSSP